MQHGGILLATPLSGMLVLCVARFAGYTFYTMKNQMGYRSLTHILGFEIANFKNLVSERMKEIESEFRFR